MTKLKNMTINGYFLADTVSLFDFSDADQVGLWGPVDDVIMGGCSQSELRAAAEGAAEFAGTLAPVGGKGFASVRTVPASINLAALDGILLTVRGDGRTYKLNLTDHRSPQGLVYQVRFDPGADEWVDLRIPFTDLVPTTRGEVQSDLPGLDTREIRTFGLMIGDNQPGLFTLMIREIRGYKTGVKQ